MDLNKIIYTPFAEGFIRAEAVTNPETQVTTFTGGLEVLSRHHDKSKSDPVSKVPKLATHPITAELAKRNEANRTASKIVEIPIRMFFDKPANAITASYVAYDATGIPVCRGDGCSAKRRVAGEGGHQTVQPKSCTGDQTCDLIMSGTVTCKRQISMPVKIVDQENPLSVFEVRTSSYNSLKALRSQLELIAKRFGGLTHVPLKLQLWQASNQASNFEPFELFKLNLDAKSEVDAMRACRLAREEEASVGLTEKPDDTFVSLNESEMDLNQVDEFSVVSDFYQPIHGAPVATRRQGVAPASAKILKTAHASAAGAINEAIAAATKLREATAKEPTE